MNNNTHSYDIPALLDYHKTSEHQKIILETLAEEGTIKATAEKLGKNKRNLQSSLSGLKKKWLAECVDDLVPEGQFVKGTSTYYKTDEETGKKSGRGQWVKTEKSKEEMFKLLSDAIKEIAQLEEDRDYWMKSFKKQVEEGMKL